MEDRPEARIYLLPGLYTSQDIRQEQALAELMGKPIRAATFYRRENRRRDLGFGLEPPGGTTYDNLADVRDGSYSDDDDYLALMQWLIGQPPQIQRKVVEYLEEPTEARFQEIVVDAGLQGKPKGPRTQISVAKFILRQLPAYHDDILAMIRREHPAKRPEATARQALRRLIRSGKVTKEVTEHGVRYTAASGEDST